MNILFVCKFNKFRSRIAEAYFRKINKNKKIKIRSAGIFRGTKTNEEIVNISKEFGIEISLKRKPRALTTALLRWQDLIVVVADDIPEILFNNVSAVKKIIFWKIRDTKLENVKEIKEIIKEIMKKCDELNEQLKKEYGRS
ncbi:MAG: hypothetical protein QW103_00470 [Candidatus Pacearchaeota archaeon]